MNKEKEEDLEDWDNENYLLDKQQTKEAQHFQRLFSI